jgi:signal transduction histidine kinase
VRHVIEEQNLRLRELDQLKSEFVANVSHELRTPLTSILGFTEILIDGAAGDIGTEQQEYLEIIERSSRRMLRLIDDLLLLSRLETRSIEVRVEEIDLTSLIQEAGLELSLSAEKAGVSLACSVDGDAPMQCDRERIRQIIDNLVNNAVKFTPSGGTVTLSGWRESGAWMISVADNGIGIPESDLENLFKKFFRASNADPKITPGTGLGLTITKAIVEAHRGTISVESIQGTGTTFTVCLPD